MTKTFIARNSFTDLLHYMKTQNHKKPFIVTGQNSFHTTLAIETVQDIYDTNYTLFTDFSPNPKIEDALKGVTAFQATDCDCILAVGGGSMIDMAKLINAASHNDGDFADYVTNTRTLEHRGMPLYFAPTTSGSGSEATHFAVIYIGDMKYSLATPHFYADALCVDANLSDSMPAGLRAATGFDALSQATESYWASGATDISRAYAKQALELAIPNLTASIQTPTPENKEAMMLAGHYAGQAINISKTTVAHALSYHITKTYDVPHGHAVALTLGEFFIAHDNADTNKISTAYSKESLQQTMQEIFGLYGCSNGLEAQKIWYKFMRECALEADFRKIGMTTEAQKIAMVNSVNPERLSNNPVTFTVNDILDILNIPT